MKLHHLFCALLVATVCVASAAPIKYILKNKGEKVGTMVEETTGDDENGYVDDATWTMTQDSKTTTIHEITHYGKDGVNTSKTFEVTGDGHEAKAKATLGDDGAKVSIWNDSEKDEKDVPLGSKVSRADATNFWFKKVTPEPNTTVTYQSFDMQKLEWSDVTLTFVGKKSIKVGGQDMDGNEITRTEGEDKTTVYVDAHGDALLVEEGDFTIERDFSV